MARKVQKRLQRSRPMTLFEIYEEAVRLEHLRQQDAAAGDPAADLERGLRDLAAAQYRKRGGKRPFYWEVD